MATILSQGWLDSITDCTPVGNAKVAGMAKDLHLVGNQYNVALTMFFIPYALLEVPCNIILKMTRPSVWLACLMFAWGVVMYISHLYCVFVVCIKTDSFLGP